MTTDCSSSISIVINGSSNDTNLLLNSSSGTIADSTTVSSTNMSLIYGLSMENSVPGMVVNPVLDTYFTARTDIDGDAKYNLLAKVASGENKIGFHFLQYSARESDASWNAESAASRAFDLVGEVPFGLNKTEMRAWLNDTGTAEVNAILTTLGQDVIAFPGIIFEQAMSGWSNTPLTTLQDFSGLKMRVIAYYAEIAESVGGLPIALAAADILAAALSENLDFVEFNMPMVDAAINGMFSSYGYPLSTMFNHLYLNGWQEKTNIGWFVINKTFWNTLSLAVQDKFRDDMNQMENDFDIAMIKNNAAALTAFNLDPNLTIHNLDPTIVSGFKDLWTPIDARLKAANPTWLAMQTSMDAFRTPQL